MSFARRSPKEVRTNRSELQLHTAHSWLRASRPGFCAVTETTGSCEGDSGAFALDICASSSWERASRLLHLYSLVDQRWPR